MLNLLLLFVIALSQEMNNREYIFESPPSALNDETIIIKMDHSMQSEAIQSKEIKIRSEISRVFSIRSVKGAEREQQVVSSPYAPASRNQQRNARVCGSLCLCVRGGLLFGSRSDFDIWV